MNYPIKPKTNNFFFWQSKKDWLIWFEKSLSREKVLIILNYIIWFFFIYISYLLIKKDTNVFWQLFIATVIGELIERYLKNKIFWRRPLFEKKDNLPPGLVTNWYKTGAFPSGHTIKAFYFLLFIIQYHVFSIPLFLTIVSPLLFFRVLIGLHYPIDIIGGIVIGWIIWLSTKWILFPIFLTEIIKNIFNTVFFIK